MATISLDSGILSLSAMERDLVELNEQIQSTKEAQAILNKNAAALAQYLHEFNETETPYDLQPATSKLRDVSIRMTTVETIMNDVHDRLSALQRQIAREIFKYKKEIRTGYGDVVIPEPPTH